MKKIEYKHFEHGDIHHLKELCNNLMKFQSEKATIHPEIMASMNFDNRFAPDYANASNKYVSVAYDGDLVVGFAFATISEVSQEILDIKSEWEKLLGGRGFYPENYAVPVTIGTYKLLYVNPEYRGLNIGGQLSELIMNWLKSHDHVDELWVYVANGNESVGELYKKYGFTYSHSVFNGFIEAFSQKL